MKNTQKSNSSHTTAMRFQRSALAAACAVAVGGFALSGAHAQSMTYSLSFAGPTQTFNQGTYNDKFVRNEQATSAPVTANNNNAFTGATFYAPSSVPSSITVSGNSSNALAIGNDLINPNLIDLILMQSFSGSAGILSGQLRGGLATATQTDITVGVVEANQTPAPITISGNVIASSTTLNQARSTVTGAVPPGYASSAQGSVAAGYTTGGLTPGISSTTQGSVGISSQQTAVNAAANAGSLASVDTAKVTLDLQATSGSTASSPLVLTGNAITTAFGANAATNTFSATAGASPTFQGSVAVNNAQANIEADGTATTRTSSISGSSITADIRNRVLIPASGTTTLTAVLDVSSNTMAAVSTGNTAGNTLGFGAGLNVAGNATNSANSLTNGASTLTANLTADLVLMNGQGNQGTRLESFVDQGKISAKVDTTGVGSSISVNSNTISTAATGNRAGSLIAANSTSFAATVAAANSQSNDATPIRAITESGVITIGVGQSGAPAVTGPITASANTIGAIAQGSVATAALSIDSTNLSILRPGAFSSQAVADTAGFGAVSASSGASATNLQGNYGASTPIIASVSNGSIAVNVIDVPAEALIALKNASVTMDGNVINANAAGNSAGTSAALSGTNGSAQASVGNTQFNGNLITGTISDSGVTMRSSDVSASALTLTNSTVAASALANNAVNTVSANVTNLMTGTSSMGSVDAVTSNGTAAQSNANFGIASGQRNEAGTLASNLSGGSSAAIQAGAGSISANSALTASNNSITADTTGNRIANTLSISATNLNTVGNAATQIGGISNLQVNAVDGVANALVGGSDSSVTRAGIDYQKSLSASTLTVSGNKAASTSLGNEATNLINVAGGSLTSLASTTPTGLTSAAGSTIQNEFALLNRQDDSVSTGRLARTQGVTVGISDIGLNTGVSTSSLTVSTNRITAEARNNTATNAANLTGFSTLSSGAGLLNQQSSGTAVAAEATDGSLRIRALAATNGVTDSSLALTDNRVQALAVGSSADNSVAVQASNLSGNANLSKSGIPTLFGSLDAEADYNLVNQQSQTANVTALASAPARIMLGGSAATGGSLTLSGNVIQAIGQATSAVNGLSLTGINVMPVTGELASSQTTSGTVSATTIEAAGIGAVAIDALSMSGTPVAVTGNKQLASAGQNQAFNTQSVQATGIAGKALGFSIDFLTDNTQNASGSVSAISQPKQTGVVVGTVTNGSLAVSGNSAAANASSNDSVNRLSLMAAGALAASGLVVNDQRTSSDLTSVLGSVPAPASVGVAPTGGLVTSTNFTDTTVAVARNTQAARADGNIAVNTLAAGGASIAVGSSNFFGENFITGNLQSATGGLSAASTAGVIGATVGAASGTPFSVTANTVSAAANANQASSTQTLAAVGTLTTSSVVVNLQNSDSGVLSASVTTATVGLAGVAGNSLAASPVAVTGNSLLAQAGRNSASNSLAATGSAVNGSPAGIFSTSFNVISGQEAQGDVTAANTAGTVGVSAATANGSALSIAGNKVVADANSNTVTNTLGLAALGTLNTDGIVDNSQQASGAQVSATVATTAIGVVSTNSLANSPIAVTGNTLDAKASRNIATNSLTAGAATLNGSGPSGFQVNSDQSGSGNVNATNTLGLIGALQKNASGTSLSVSGNTAASSANVNIASNSLALNALSALNNKAQVSNLQTASDGVVTATTGGTSAGSRATVGVASLIAGGNALDASPVTVSGNTLSAQGGGNTALNALEAIAVGSIGGSLNPTFAVLNNQSNYASINTTVQFANIGATASSFVNTSASVQSNIVLASGYGNSASNSIGLSALSSGQNLASASVSNTQSNSASVSSMVKGVTIGVIGGGASGGSSTITGNAITAQAIGNSASNLIVAR